jgi:hypothetical protein
MKQLNIRLDDEVYAEFAKACEASALSMNQCFTILADVYAKNIMTGETFHINGAPCPVTSMIQALATATQQEIRTRQQRAAEWKTPTHDNTEQPRNLPGEVHRHGVPAPTRHPDSGDRGRSAGSRRKTIH